MRFISRKKRSVFYPAELEESTEPLSNPSRGWYQIHTFALDETIDFEELYWCLGKTDMIALVLVDIGAFHEKEIPKDALRRLFGLLDFFRENGREVILRITYDREGRGMEREPGLSDMVICHMEQLGAVIRQFQDHILIVQGILVGSWGEMHDSKFLSDTCLCRLFSVWRNALGDKIAVAVRTPRQWRVLHNKGETSLQAGLFDDGMFGSDGHLGTYGWKARADAEWQEAWSVQDELDFTGKIGAVIPYGGEAVAAAYEDRETMEGFTPDTTVARLRRTNVCYLNRVHDAARLDQWRETIWHDRGVWDGKSMFDYIGAHLGYRFIVRKAELVKKGETALRMFIENTGFTTIKEETELLFCMEHKTGETETFILPDDLRSLPSGQTMETEVRLPQGEYEAVLRLRRTRDRQKILFANVSAAEGVLLGSCSIFY